MRRIPSFTLFPGVTPERPNRTRTPDPAELGTPRPPKPIVAAFRVTPCCFAPSYLRVPQRSPPRRARPRQDTRLRTDLYPRTGPRHRRQCCHLQHHFIGRFEEPSLSRPVAAGFRLGAFPDLLRPSL